MNLRKVIAAWALLLMVLSVSADESRIADEMKDSRSPVIPLKEAIGEKALNDALASGLYTYTGNAKCRLCHRDFFLGRKHDAHDHAFEKLIGTEYESNSRCLACHTTGYGVKGGFSSIKETPGLMNVQCEGCHGPGSEHIRHNAKGGFLAGPDRPEILKKMCLSCHNDRWDRSFSNFRDTFSSYKNATPSEPTAAPVAGK